MMLCSTWLLSAFIFLLLLPLCSIASSLQKIARWDLRPVSTYGLESRLDAVVRHVKAVGLGYQ